MINERFHHDSVTIITVLNRLGFGLLQAKDKRETRVKQIKISDLVWSRMLLRGVQQTRYCGNKPIDLEDRATMRHGSGKSV